jgi:transposase
LSSSVSDGPGERAPLHPVLSFDPQRLSFKCTVGVGASLTFVIQSTAPTAACPLCGQTSARPHSRYLRRLADLPCHDRPVRLHLEVRRFFCANADCPRRIFAERLPAVAAVHARTTVRLDKAHCNIGLALGGEAGSRLAARLAMPTSPDTLLRRVRRAPLPQHPAVRVLGVDDWAFRKGHRYGTILCDLERHRPVELLPERSAEALSAWLKKHPEVEVISRDRADEYIRGAGAGAPQAVQVADRWHLLRNLQDALKATVDRHHAEIRAAARAVVADATTPAPGQTDLPAPAAASEAPASARQTQRQQVRRQRRERLYDEVLALHGEGISQRVIADRLGVHRSTVRRFVESGSFPERAGRRSARRTDCFIDYLKDRWAAGCRNAMRLYAELQDRGYSGSYYSVRRQLAKWRSALPPGDEGKPPRPVPAVMGRPSARRVSWLLLMDGTDLDPQERQFREQLEERCPELRGAAELARAFRALVREHREAGWDAWLSEVCSPASAKEMRGFAEGLKKDEVAVRAALRLEWSNGQVEGQVNRLKLIKRQMFGRAKFDLLRQRVLLAG